MAFVILHGIATDNCFLRVVYHYYPQNWTRLVTTGCQSMIMHIADSRATTLVLTFQELLNNRGELNRHWGYTQHDNCKQYRTTQFSCYINVTKTKYTWGKGDGQPLPFPCSIMGVVWQAKAWKCSFKAALVRKWHLVFDDIYGHVQ